MFIFDSELISRTLLLFAGDFQNKIGTVQEKKTVQEKSSFQIYSLFLLLKT